MVDAVQFARSRPPAGPAPKSGASRLFENAGVAIMQAGDTQLIADAGPMGPGGGGHSHADALSFVLRRGQEDLLIDAGTFTYVGDLHWRNWFRGTAAHNTIRIDGLDQAKPVGPFHWAAKPDVVLKQWSTTRERDYLEAVCRYRGLEHRRRIWFVKPGHIFILDDVTGTGEHRLEQFWHSGEEVRQESPRSFLLGACARLLLSQDAALEIGGVNGWRSKVFGIKEPSAVLCAAQNRELPARFAAVIDLSGNARRFEVASEITGTAEEAGFVLTGDSGVL